MLDNKQLCEFFFNIADSNSIVTGGNMSVGKPYCSVMCKFCMCSGDSPGIDSKIPFIEMAELEQGIKFINWSNKTVYLGDGISRASAEMFMHPQAYDVLEFVCKNLPDHHVTVMTTGIMIKEDRIEFLNSLKNLTTSISVNTLQESERKKIMPHPETEKVKMLIKRLDRVGTQWLDLGDTGILKKDIEELNSIKKMDRFQLRRCEHSRFHSEDAISLSKKSIVNYENSLAWVQSNYPSATHWSPYLRYDLKKPDKMRNAYNYLAAVCDFLGQHKDKKYLFCAAESSYDLWNIWLRAFGNVKVIMVKNATYAGSVTVAGLLTFSDIEISIKQIDTNGIDGILVPKIMLNKSMSDLNGLSIVDFHSKIKIYPTIL
jgi:hypothetical protein